MYLFELHSRRGRGPERFPAVRPIVLAMIAALVAAGVTSSAAAASTPYGVNLLYNPNAEHVISGGGIAGWSRINGSEVVRYGAPGGVPTVAEAKRIGGGHRFFSGGPANGSNCGNLAQNITFHGRGAATDSGHVELDVVARMATFGHDTDQAYLVVMFINSGGTITGNVDLTARATNDRFVRQAMQVNLPWHTRRLEIHLGTNTPQGAYCDGYVDNISLKLKHVD